MPFINLNQNSGLRIGHFVCGGQPGENPPLLMGTIFYDGQQLVSNHQLGIFDKDKALKQIRLAEETSEKFHMPIAFDIVASTPVAMLAYLEFVSEHSNLPFVLDSSDPAPRLAGLEYCHKHDLLNRAIYNSITEGYSSEELDGLARYLPAGIIVLAINQEDYSPSGTIKILNEIVPTLYANSITNIMVDVCVLDQVSLKCAIEIARAVRSEYGFPVGGAPCNGIYMWDRLKRLPVHLFQAALATTVTYATASAFDFAFGGPIKTIGMTALSAAVTSIYNRYYLQQETPDLMKEHPINYIL